MHKEYGIIGKSLVHSFSQQYFQTKFEKEHVKEASYQLFPLQSLNEFRALIDNNKTLFGLNVTIPYKESIVKYLDNVDDVAQEVGAVNTIKIIRENNQCITMGYNTDVIGFESIINNYSISSFRSALILGTGGAAKAVAYVLKKNGISYRFISRQIKENSLTFKQLNEEIVKQSSLIIHCTPIGMFPAVDDFPDIPYHALTPKHIVIDLIYNPSETIFLKKAKMQGASIENGYAMLCCQAEASWNIWNTK